MTEKEFAYWLQGFVELTCAKQVPTKEQWDIITKHLRSVFQNYNVKQIQLEFPLINPTPGLNPPYVVTC